jgi:ribosomal-protein-alanine N-acetyltransferase
VRGALSLYGEMSSAIITTNRLRLVRIGAKHKGDLYKLLSNPIVHKYFPEILDRDESKAFYEKIQARYKTDGYCFWAVIRRSDNLFLGICGLLSQLIDGQEEVEVGYRISNEFWGHGYGTEAAKGCIEYGRKILKLGSIISLIRPVNLPSIRVAEKNGLRMEKETIFQNSRHLVYRIILD